MPDEITAVLAIAFVIAVLFGSIAAITHVSAVDKVACIQAMSGYTATEIAVVCK